MPILSVFYPLLICFHDRLCSLHSCPILFILQIYFFIFIFHTQTGDLFLEETKKHPVNRLDEESSRVWRVEWGVRSFRILRWLSLRSLDVVSKSN